MLMHYLDEDFEAEVLEPYDTDPPEVVGIYCPVFFLEQP